MAIQPIQPIQPIKSYDRIANVLVADGWRRVRGRDNRAKLRGSCLFHLDPQPSADFYPDDGWYYCHGCGESYPLDDVLDALGLPESRDEKGQHIAGLTPDSDQPVGEDRIDHHHSTLGQPTAVYTYRFPDGKLSHYKVRFEPKTFRIHAPDGRWRRPDVCWPIYGDYKLPKGLNIIINESEKAVPLIAAAMSSYQDVLIVSITMGASKAMESSDNRSALVARLKQLDPVRILVWPDNDRAGRDWAGPLYRQLSAEAFPVKLVDVRALPLDTGQGPDDFVARGGDLEEVFHRHFQGVGGYTMDALIEGTVVTSEGFLLHASREVMPFRPDALQIHYYRATGDATPQPKIIQRLTNSLRSKACDTPVEVWYRRWHDEQRTELYWRPKPLGYAYRINFETVTIANDPPGALLLTPGGEPVFSSIVDESGARGDLEHLCEFFGQDQTSTTLIEGWLMTALLGLETPIMILRGEAGSGKTIFSRILAGIIEPTVPSIEMPSSHKSHVAERALRNGLQRSAVAVIDNVSSMAHDSEDLLCRFVTGYSTMYSPLYEERVVNLTMRRGLILTTANWAPSRGDLASRAIVCRTVTPKFSLTTEKIVKQFTPIVERIRGYLFQTAQLYYRRAAQVEDNNTIRLAGLSQVFGALGYDLERLSRRLTLTRSQLASESDSWYDVMLDFYHQQFGESDSSDAHFVPQAIRAVKWEEMKGFIGGRTGYTPTDRELSRFVNDALPKFRDYGFTMERKSNGQNRFWVMRCLFEPQGEE